jgi:hypothetical protein
MTSLSYVSPMTVLHVKHKTTWEFNYARRRGRIVRDVFRG